MENREQASSGSEQQEAIEEWNVEFRYMQLEDIPQIMEVELECFTVPWTPEAFHNELTHNRNAHYIVMLLDDRIIGYAGMWLMIDEAHVTNVGIREKYRGRKLGQKLMQRLVDEALLRGAERMTLEVRVSNLVAQRLYEKFGFRPVGVRRQYYSDNKEDAIIMWVDLLDNHSAPKSC